MWDYTPCGGIKEVIGVGQCYGGSYAYLRQITLPGTFFQDINTYCQCYDACMSLATCYYFDFGDGGFYSNCNLYEYMPRDSVQTLASYYLNTFTCNIASNFFKLFL